MISKISHRNLALNNLIIYRYNQILLNFSFLDIQMNVITALKFRNGFSGGGGSRGVRTPLKFFGKSAPSSQMKIDPPLLTFQR